MAACSASSRAAAAFTLAAALIVMLIRWADPRLGASGPPRSHLRHVPDLLGLLGDQLAKGLHQRPLGEPGGAFIVDADQLRTRTG